MICFKNIPITDLWLGFMRVYLKIWLNDCASNKHAFAIILLFHGLAASAQQSAFMGMYCTDPGFTGYCITFSEGARFEFYESSCTTGRRGIGSYTVAGDSLWLNFEASDSLSFPVLEIQSSKIDSTQIQWDISVTDQYDSAKVFPYKIQYQYGNTSDSVIADKTQRCQFIQHGSADIHIVFSMTGCRRRFGWQFDNKLPVFIERNVLCDVFNQAIPPKETLWIIKSSTQKEMVLDPVNFQVMGGWLRLKKKRE